MALQTVWGSVVDSGQVPLSPPVRPVHVVLTAKPSPFVTGTGDVITGYQTDIDGNGGWTVDVVATDDAVSPVGAYYQVVDGVAAPYKINPTNAPGGPYFVGDILVP